MSYILIGTTVAGAGIAAVQAEQSNKAIEQSQESAVEGANVQNTQLARQTATEEMKRSRETARVLGRLRVAGTEAGTDDAALQSLATEAAINTQENNAVAGSNFTSNVARINSGVAATIASLAAGHRDLALSTLNGGLQGLQIGLSINGALASAGGAAAGSEIPGTDLPDVAQTRYTDLMPRIA